MVPNLINRVNRRFTTLSRITSIFLVHDFLCWDLQCKNLTIIIFLLFHLGLSYNTIHWSPLSGSWIRKLTLNIIILFLFFNIVFIVFITIKTTQLLFTTYALPDAFRPLFNFFLIDFALVFTRIVLLFLRLIIFISFFLLLIFHFLFILRFFIFFIFLIFLTFLTFLIFVFFSSSLAFALALLFLSRSLSCSSVSLFIFIFIFIFSSSKLLLLLLILFFILLLLEVSLLLLTRISFFDCVVVIVN